MNQVLSTLANEDIPTHKGGNDMEKHTKRLYIITIANFILFVLMLLFCFQNKEIDVDGLCIDCIGESGTTDILFMGFLINILQVVFAAIMCICLRWFRKPDGNLGIAVFSVINMILSFWQVFWFISCSVDFGTGHGSPTTARGQLIVDMLEIQVSTVKVMNIVMIIVNILLLICVRTWYATEKKKLYEYLNS